MDHRFHTSDPVRLYVEVRRGSIRVEAGDEARDSAETHVSVQGTHADQVSVTHEGDQVAVVAPRHPFGFGSSVEDALDVVVHLPSGSTAVLRAGSAEVRVSGRLATLAVKSGSGEVRVLDVSGRALVETGSGNVVLQRVSGELQVKSASGDVHIDDLAAAARISTGSGDVDLGSTTAPVAVKTGSGDLAIGQAGADVTMTSGTGHAVVRRADRGRLTLHGASGDVRVGIPAGTPVWTDITTLTGNVVSGLEPTGAPADGQDHVEVRARLATGNVELVRL
jgi:DUF4097 and DUF4098 domain-containing protein YvlB